MKRRLFRLALAALLAAAAFPAAACRRDSECLAPDTCFFAAGVAAAEGLCLTEVATGTQPEEKRRAARPLGDRKRGDTCEFSIDCAPGQYCFKPEGGMEGLCYDPPAKE